MLMFNMPCCYSLYASSIALMIIVVLCIKGFSEEKVQIYIQCNT